MTKRKSGTTHHSHGEERVEKEVSPARPAAGGPNFPAVPRERIVERLQHEFKDLNTIDSDNIRGRIPDDGDVFEWHVELKGPVGTGLAGLVLPIVVKAGPEYPFVAPTMRFTLPAPFHPNVCPTTGTVCLDILTGALWSPALTIPVALRAIVQRMSEPDPFDALNGEANALFRANPIEFQAASAARAAAYHRW